MVSVLTCMLPCFSLIMIKSSVGQVAWCSHRTASCLGRIEEPFVSSSSMHRCDHWKSTPARPSNLTSMSLISMTRPCFFVLSRRKTAPSGRTRARGANAWCTGSERRRGTTGSSREPWTRPCRGRRCWTCARRRRQTDIVTRVSREIPSSVTGGRGTWPALDLLRGLLRCACEEEEWKA